MSQTKYCCSLKVKIFRSSKFRADYATEYYVAVLFRLSLQCTLLHYTQGRNEGNNSPGTEWLRGALKRPINVTCTFFNTVHLLPKDLRFEYGGAKLASCPRPHLTSLRPWLYHFHYHAWYPVILFISRVFFLCRYLTCQLFVVFLPQVVRITS